jgi:hypothetical protein
MRVIVVLVVVALSARVVADPDRDPQIAKRLFTEGRALYDQQKFIEACVLFEKSYQLDPAVGTRLNLAECAERDGKPRAAWLLWVAAADEFERDNDEARAKFARDRADALAGKLATVVVHIPRPNTRGLTLQIGGRSVEPATTVIERLEEGAIEVTVSAPRRETFSTRVTVATGGRVVVDVPKLQRIGTEPETDDQEPRPRTRLWWGLAGGCAGLTIASTIFAVYGHRRIVELESELVTTQAESDRVNADGAAWARRTNISVIAAITGAVLTTVFVVEGIRARRTAKRAATAVVVPVVTPRIAGATLELRW